MMESYPYLSQLLGAYFHQDAYDDGDSDEEIMRNFRKSSWDYQRMGLRADIRRFIHYNRDGLLKALEETFHPSLILGNTDEEARRWLMKIESLTEARSSEDVPQSPLA